MLTVDWIHIAIGIVAVALATLGITGFRRKTARKRPPPAPLHPAPPEPEKTVDDHETEVALEPDAIADASDRHNADPDTVRALVDAANNEL